MKPFDDDQLHDLLNQQASLEEPSSNFTQRVMNHLDAYPLPSAFSPRNGIFLLCGVLVAIGIGLLLLQAGAFDSFNGAIKPDALPIKKEWITRIPVIPLNGKLFMKMMMVVATGVSFLVLDRTVLRPMFNRRSL